MDVDPRLIYLVPSTLINQQQPLQQSQQLQQIVHGESDFLVPEDVKRSLTVFGIPSHWTSEDLRDLFVPYGKPLQFRLDLDHTRGGHRGRGFVQLDSAEAAQLAVRSLDGFQIDSNHCLRVFFKAFRRNGLSPSYYRSKIGEKLIPENNLFVFHIPPAWNKAKFESEFSKFGKILSFYFPFDNSTSWAHKGYGFVCYKDHQDAARAITVMDGKEVEPGRRLKVEFKRQQPQQQSISRRFSSNATSELFYWLDEEKIWTSKELAIPSSYFLLDHAEAPHTLESGKWSPYACAIENESASDQWSNYDEFVVDEEEKVDDSIDCQSSPGAIETTLEKEENETKFVSPFKVQIESLLSSPVISPTIAAPSCHSLCDKPFIELGDLGLFPFLEGSKNNKHTELTGKHNSHGNRRFTKLSQRDRKKSFAFSNL